MEAAVEGGSMGGGGGGGGGHFERITRDLLFEILLRVPATSLLRAKLACKTWRAVIADNRFVDSHHDRAVTGDTGFLVSFRQEGDHDYFVEADDRTGTAITISKVPPVPSSTYIRRPSRSRHVTAKPFFCRGLACHYRDDARTGIVDVTVTNPITRETVELPPLPIPPITEIDDDESWMLPRLQCGMGFDEATGACKVLVVRLWREAVFVITLGDRTWRAFERNHQHLFEIHSSEIPPVHHGGALHWFDESSAILSFDISSESFYNWRWLGIDDRFHAPYRMYQLVLLGGHDLAFESSYWITAGTPENRDLKKKCEVWDVMPEGPCPLPPKFELLLDPAATLAGSWCGGRLLLWSSSCLWDHPYKSGLASDTRRRILPSSSSSSSKEIEYVSAHHGSLMSPKEIAKSRKKTLARGS